MSVSCCRRLWVHLDESRETRRGVQGQQETIGDCTAVKEGCRGYAHSGSLASKVIQAWTRIIDVLDLNEEGTVAAATGSCWANIGYGIDGPPVVAFGGGDDGVVVAITVCLGERGGGIWADGSRGCCWGAGIGA